MKSNPLIMGHGRWRPDCCWLPWPVVGPLRSACVCRLWAVGCGLTGLAVQFSDKSALEVCNTWYALYKSTFLPFFIS